MNSVTDSLNLDGGQTNFQGQLKRLLEKSKLAYEISEHPSDIAKAFYVLLCKCQKLYFPDVDKPFDLDDASEENSERREIVVRLMDILTNIRGVTVEEVSQPERRKESYLEVLWLLDMLKSNRFDASITPEDEEYAYLHEIAQYLLSVLADIRFLFYLTKNGVRVFPLHTLLTQVIQGETFMNRDLSAAKIQILRLAVMMFKEEPQVEQILSKIERECNLKFLRFLRDANARIVDTDQLMNYLKNGVLVFYKEKPDGQGIDVLVRSKDFDYFRSKNTDMMKETDFQGHAIGYFVEYSSDGSPIETYRELMKSHDGAKKMLSLLFDEKARNVLTDYAIVQRPDGTLMPLNRFCSQDAWIIRSNEKPSKGGTDFRKTEILNAMNEYRLSPIKVSPNQMNRVTFGLCARLLSMSDKLHVADLGLDSLKDNSWYQGQTLNAWFSHKDVEKERICDAVREWAMQLDYCKEGAFDSQELRAQDFLPYSYDFQPLLHKVTGADSNERLEVFEGRSVGDGQRVQITLNGNLLPQETILSKEAFRNSQVEIPDSEESFYFCMDRKRKAAYISEDKRVLGNIATLQDYSGYLMRFETAKAIGLRDYEAAKERMELYVKAFEEIGRGKLNNLEMQLYLRLLHNMIQANVTEESVEQYFRIIKCQQKVWFQWAQDKRVEFAQDGVLYVPKDRLDNDSALYSIYVDYLKEKSVRAGMSLYATRLEMSNGNYLINGRKIEKIIFVTDNFVRGSATEKALKAYLYPEKANAKSTQSYVCGKSQRPVKIPDIISRNKPAIGLMAFYGTEEGRQEIDRFLKDYGDKTNCDILPTRFFKKLDSKFGNLATERMPHFWEPGDWIGETDYAYIREFNMPKKTGFPSTMLDPERLICMFVQKAEKS